MQYLLPKQALTSLMGRLAQLHGGALTTAVIKRFIARYRVDMAEAANPDPAAYPTFNAFFTRALKDALGLVDVRVLDHFVVPAHGHPVSFAERGLL